MPEIRITSKCKSVHIGYIEFEMPVKSGILLIHTDTHDITLYPVFDWNKLIKKQ